MPDRIETQRQPGNGADRRTAGVGASVAAEPVQDIEPRALAQSGAVAALTQRLNQLTRDVFESRQRSEQLKSALDKHTRRVQQLIGERDRLTSLLAARDAELQRLNREVGALTERARPPARRSPALLAATRRLFERIQQRRKAVRNDKPAASRPPRAESRHNEARLVPWAKDRPPGDVLAVVLFGLSEAEIERVLRVVEPYCAEHDLAPLLLTDSDSFELFRNRRVVFEFLPARSEQARLAPDLDWHLFTLRRLALIRRKWRPGRVVAFGRRAAEVVQLWRHSPFEETPVPAALNGRSAAAELAWSPALPGESLQR